MDSISYRGMPLTVLQSLGWEREPQLDESNTTYRDTRVRGNVVVAYNPSAASFVANANQTLPPNAVYGRMPDETDIAIRRFLEQPRGQLIVLSGGNPWLTSPETVNNKPATCDTRVGPTLKVNSVQKVSGERLWHIHLEFETHINARPTSLRQAIVSNRWYAVDDTDWQHLRTRIYQGICTIRNDYMQTQVGVAKFIDSLRASFCAFSVPPGMQRERVHVAVTPDGLSAHYTVVDTEQLWNKAANCPAVRIEVSDTDWMWTGSSGRALAQMGGMIGFGMRAAGSVGLNPRENAERGGALVMSTSRAMSANLPKLYKSCAVRCWGNQRTPRGKLVSYALAVAQNRVGALVAVIDTGTSEIMVSRNTNNYVDVSLTRSYGMDVAAGFVGGPAAVFVAALPNMFTTTIGNAQGEFQRSMVQTTDIDAQGISLTQDKIQVNVPFPAASGTRGTSGVNAPGYNAATFQTLVTQILESFDGNPAAAP